MTPHIVDKIKNYLVEHGSGTADELSRDLGVTRADVHYHLKKLTQAHILVSFPSTLTSAPQRGRRPNRFSLSMNAYPNNTYPLLRGLLFVVYENHEMNEIWKEIAARMTGTVPKQKHPAAILNFAISWLNSCNYQAKWEARQSGPCVILHNCPYRSLLPEFLDICQLDHHIINIITGYSISTLTHKKLADGQIRSCVFELNT